MNHEQRLVLGLVRRLNPEEENIQPLGGGSMLRGDWSQAEKQEVFDRTNPCAGRRGNSCRHRYVKVARGCQDLAGCEGWGCAEQRLGTWHLSELTATPFKEECGPSDELQLSTHGKGTMGNRGGSEVGSLKLRWTFPS